MFNLFFAAPNDPTNGPHGDGYDPSMLFYFDTKQ